MRLKQLLPALLSTNSVCLDFGSGKHSSSRQTPCGFNSKRVARLRSAVVIQSCPASSAADLGRLAVVKESCADFLTLRGNPSHQKKEQESTGRKSPHHHCVLIQPEMQRRQ